MKKSTGWLMVTVAAALVSFYGNHKVRQAVAEATPPARKEWEYKKYTIIETKKGYAVYHPMYDGAFVVYRTNLFLRAIKWIDQNDVMEMAEKLA